MKVRHLISTFQLTKGDKTTKKSSIHLPSIHINRKQSKVNKNGPILIIEDDIDDQRFIEEIYKTLNYSNELVFLDNGEIAIDYLMKMTKIPFLIISDLNMPKINGIELRARVKQNDAINIKCVPYLIFSTTVAKNFIDDAYIMGIQGYFKKPVDPDDLLATLKTIIDYWKVSYTPGMYM